MHFKLILLGAKGTHLLFTRIKPIVQFRNITSYVQESSPDSTTCEQCNVYYGFGHHWNYAKVKGFGALLKCLFDQCVIRIR